MSKDNYKMKYIEKRQEIFNNKANFHTMVFEIPADTTEYEISPSPETAVINWYQCVGNWRLQWLMEDIQDLLNQTEKSSNQIDCDKQKADILIKQLQKRLAQEKVTPQKQKDAADRFFQAIGRGCPWGTKQIYDKNSVDARLYACSCCGIKNYDDTGDNNNRQEFKIVPLSDLDILKLKEEKSMIYQKQLNV